MIEEIDLDSLVALMLCGWCGKEVDVTNPGITPDSYYCPTCKLYQLTREAVQAHKNSLSKPKPKGKAWTYSIDLQAVPVFRGHE